VAWLPISFSWTPAWYCPSSVRSRMPHAASSVASRCAVDIGSPVSRAISVNEYVLPFVKVRRIEMTLLVTDRPVSAELPAIDAVSPNPVYCHNHTEGERYEDLRCH
jgi:hypothetical protein